MGILTSIVSFVVAIGILVIVHEFGHYAVARLCGVRVLRFSIGFGTPLARWTGRRNGTEWRIGALPLGGYVKMLDERDSELPIPPDQLVHAFNRQRLGKRVAIVMAGPLANFALAVVLFASIFAAGVAEPLAIVAAPPADSPAALAGLSGGEQVVGLRDAGGTVEKVRSWPDLRWKLLNAAFDRHAVVLIAKQGGGSYDFAFDLSRLADKDFDDTLLDALGLHLGGIVPVVVALEPGSVAEAAGLQPGDVIRAADGKPITDVQQFIALIQAHAGDTVTLDVERGGQPKSVPVVPAAKSADGKTVGRIGATLGGEAQTVEVRYAPFEALWLGARRTWDISVFSLRMFGRMIVGEASLKNLSGPVAIADYAGKSARMGVSSFVSFLALVSISLGVLNLLPIPILDGGHLLYYSVEAVTGKAVSDRWQFILQRAGIACIFVLSAIALFNDLTRLFHF